MMSSNVSNEKHDFVEYDHSAKVGPEFLESSISEIELSKFRRAAPQWNERRIRRSRSLYFAIFFTTLYITFVLLRWLPFQCEFLNITFCSSTGDLWHPRAWVQSSSPKRIKYLGENSGLPEKAVDDPTRTSRM